jgi:hypothetical protein
MLCMSVGVGLDGGQSMVMACVQLVQKETLPLCRRPPEVGQLRESLRSLFFVNGSKFTDGQTMHTHEILKHSTWECKYHAVFITKCRHKALHGQWRRDMGPVFQAIAEQKGGGRSPDAGYGITSDHANWAGVTLLRCPENTVMGTLKGWEAQFSAAEKPLPSGHGQKGSLAGKRICPQVFFGSLSPQRKGVNPLGVGSTSSHGSQV